MKRTIAALMAVCMIFTLCACSGKAENAAVTKAPEVPSAPPAAETAAPTAAPLPTVDEQLRFIINNRAVWDCSADYESDFEFHRYAVTDFDANGRLEVFAAITQGTGIFTSGRFWEVNEDCTALVEYPLGENEYNIIPEVMMNEVPVYKNPADGCNYYIFTDTLRNGAAENYQTVNPMLLKDGTITFFNLAFYQAIATNGVVTETYTDINDKPITAEQYASIADTIYSGFEKSTAKLGWFSLRAGDYAELVSMSYRVFCGTLAAMPELEPEETLLPTPLPMPEPTVPVGVNGNITVTKNPTSESLSIGGKTWFIAHANNADKLTWQFIDLSGKSYSVDETMAANPGLSLQVLDGDTIAVDRVPESINGWGVQAIFSNSDYAAATSPAYIYVGDFVGAYSGLIQSYKNAYAAGEINYEVAQKYGISEMAAYSKSAGYALKDLDKDGVPELIIAGIGYNYDGDKMIYDIATLRNGSVVRLFTSQARDKCYLRTDNLLLEIGSGGAAYTSFILHKFSNGDFTKVIELSSDIDDNAVGFWHFIENGAAEKKLSYDDGLKLAESYEAAEYLPPLTKIS